MSLLRQKDLQMKRRQTYQFGTILLTLASALIISCGGGGGGGGGAAAGPSASSGTPSNNTPAPTRSAAAEIISFKFEQAKNASTLSALSTDLEGHLSDTNTQEIIVDYNYGTLDAHPELKPTIKISPRATIVEDTFTQTEENGETIWTTNDAIDFFTNAVTFTVKAENGTEKAWTVTLNEMAAGEYRIIYGPDSIINNPYPETYNESEDIHFDDNLYNKIIKKNYYFDGWYAEESCTTPVTGWSRMEKSGDVTLYAKWQPAPYADLEHSKVFANEFQ